MIELLNDIVEEETEECEDGLGNIDRKGRIFQVLHFCLLFLSTTLLLHGANLLQQCHFELVSTRLKSEYRFVHCMKASVDAF